MSDGKAGKGRGQASRQVSRQAGVGRRRGGKQSSAQCG